jgi:antitoxin component YwqK of YwqJK toxin-antitoxin module
MTKNNFKQKRIISNEKRIMLSYCVLYYNSPHFLPENGKTLETPAGLSEGDKLEDLCEKLEEKIKEVHFFDEKIGKIVGKRIRYFPNGCIMDEVRYKAGLKEGQQIRYYFQKTKEKAFIPPKTPYFVKNYVSGKKQGETIYYFSDGKIRKRYNYENGLKDNDYTIFFYNGQIREQGYYCEGKKEGTFRKFFKNGIMRYTCNSINNYFEGEARAYFPTGKIKCIMHQVKSMAHGKILFFDIQGKIVKEGTYKFGSANGKWKNFYVNGNVMIICHMWHNKKQGSYQKFDKDGNLIYFTTMINDIPQGLTMKIKGNLKIIGELKQGKYHGKVKRYANEFLKYEQEYFNGKLNGLYINYRSSGEVKKIIHYINGLKHGLEILYHRNGIINQKQEYFKGEKHGKFINYYCPNGNIREIMHYDHNKLHGNCIYYYEHNDYWLKNYCDGKEIYEEMHEINEGINGEINEIVRIATIYTVGNTVYTITKRNDVIIRCKIERDDTLISETSYYETGILAKEDKLIEKNYYLGKNYYQNGILESEKYLYFRNPEERHLNTICIISAYHDNGELFIQNSIEDYAHHGVCCTYYDTGILHKKYNYENGLKHGICKLYRENGKLHIYKIYCEGICVLKKRFSIFSRINYLKKKDKETSKQIVWDFDDQGNVMYKQLIFGKYENSQYRYSPITKQLSELYIENKKWSIKMIYDEPKTIILRFYGEKKSYGDNYIILSENGGNTSIQKFREKIVNITKKKQREMVEEYMELIISILHKTPQKSL